MPNDKPKRARRIDPIIFKYAPQQLPAHIEQLHRAGLNKKYADKLLLHWYDAKAIACEYVELANIEHGYQRGVIVFLANKYGLSREAIYNHLWRVIKQLYREHPEELQAPVKGGESF